MRGRKPTPTADKILAGNPGGRPLNTAEPELSRADDRPPAYLSPAAKRHWRGLAPELIERGVLKTADRETLAAYCTAVAKWIQAEKEIGNHGMTQTNDKGMLLVSPWVRISDMSVKQMVKLASELGITPASRTRVKADGVKRQSLAEMLFPGAPIVEDPPPS